MWKQIKEECLCCCLTCPSFCLLRLLQNCRDDSLNVAVPMRMLEIFSSEKTYLPVIPDANYVASLLEQILHYMVQKGKFTATLFIGCILKWTGILTFALSLLFRILQITVYSRESQASFQSGVQWRSLCPSSKHTVGAHPQTSALYLLLLHNRRKVLWETNAAIHSGPHTGRTGRLAALQCEQFYSAGSCQKPHDKVV